MSKLGIVVPYRDREEHLEAFIPHMESFLGDLDYEIVIAEQPEGLSFNRGMMKNLGFLYIEDRCDQVCFHDIDMLPTRSDYSPTDIPILLADEVQAFGYKRPYSRFFGGVIMFPSKDFRTINGYCNDYWGWGVEDDDLKRRCQEHKIKTGVRSGRYDSLDHETEGDTVGGKRPSKETINNRVLFYSKKFGDFSKVGLSDLKPKIISETKIGKKSMRVKFEVQR
jgi:hypothetical protein